MTIDERLELLFQSTQSLRESVQQNTILIRGIGIQMKETDDNIGIIAETIRDLRRNCTQPSRPHR